MICKYCDTEHPENEIANPHYCIARLIEKSDSIEEERDQLLDVIPAKDAKIKQLYEELESFKRSGFRILRADGDPNGIAMATSLVVEKINADNAEVYIPEPRLRAVEEELAAVKLQIENQDSVLAVSEKQIAALTAEVAGLREALEKGIYLADFVAGERDLDKCEDCKMSECCACCVIVAGRFLKSVPHNVAMAIAQQALGKEQP